LFDIIARQVPGGIFEARRSQAERLVLQAGAHGTPGYRSERGVAQAYGRQARRLLAVRGHAAAASSAASVGTRGGSTSSAAVQASTCAPITPPVQRPCPCTLFRLVRGHQLGDT
jgi:hypothetical protein